MILRLAASLLLGRHDGGRLVLGPRDVDDLTVEQLGILLRQQRQEAFKLFSHLYLAGAGGSLWDPEFVAAKIIILLGLRLYLIFGGLLFGVPTILNILLLQGDGEARRQLLEELLHLIFLLGLLGHRLRAVGRRMLCRWGG